MVCMLQTLHPLDLDFHCSDSLTNFQPNIDVELSMDYFKLTFLHMSYFFCKWSIMHGLQTFRDSFDLEDLVSGFI